MAEQDLSTPDAGVRGWIVNAAKRNYWRVAEWYEFKDLEQDGYLWYYICRDKYPNVTDRGHFMSLFKTCYTNHITDLANSRSRLHEIPVTAVVGDVNPSPFFEQVMESEPESASLFTLLHDAPKGLKRVFELLLSESGLKLLAEPYHWVDGIRETTNERFCRILEFDPTAIDVLGCVRAYLTSSFGLGLGQDKDEEYLACMFKDRRYISV